MLRILNIGGKFWVYSLPPVQEPIWEGKMYRIFDDVEDAVKFRSEIG